MRVEVYDGMPSRFMKMTVENLRPGDKAFISPELIWVLPDQTVYVNTEESLSRNPLEFVDINLVIECKEEDEYILHIEDPRVEHSYSFDYFTDMRDTALAYFVEISKVVIHDEFDDEFLYGEEGDTNGEGQEEDGSEE